MLAALLDVLNVLRFQLRGLTELLASTHLCTTALHSKPAPIDCSLSKLYLSSSAACRRSKYGTQVSIAASQRHALRPKNPEDNEMEAIPPTACASTAKNYNFSS
eukprot:1884030-Amphidinium_carterae.1